MNGIDAENGDAGYDAGLPFGFRATQTPLQATSSPRSVQRGIGAEEALPDLLKGSC
jgi:hypothetical protein